jgi:16S rRNA processing protein RimM
MELIAIGRVSRPIGTRGEIKIQSLTDDVKRFEMLKSVWIGENEGNARIRRVCAVRINREQVSMRLDNVADADSAEKIRNLYLFVPEDEAVELREGRFFIDDILGCEVVTEEKMKVGIVSDLLSLPANDIWVISDGAREILIPAVKDIVRQVDVRNKRIVIHAPEGLLD